MMFSIQWEISYIANFSDLVVKSELQNKESPTSSQTQLIKIKILNITFNSQDVDTTFSIPL